MKKYFATGLVILLPVSLTILVVGFLFNLLTEPFLGISQAILGHYGLLESGFLFLSAPQLQTLISKILILIVLFVFTVLLGILARWIFFHYIIGFWEALIHRLPFVSTIYKTCKDVIKTIFTSKTTAFKQVVLVRFPNPQTLTLGLVTREDASGMHPSLGSNYVVVFVPTTPNPTSGFLTIVRREEITYLDMPVEDAFKYVISCGVIMSPIRSGISREEESKFQDVKLRINQR